MPGATTGDARLLTLKDLCDRWRVSPRYIYRRTERGAADPLPCIRIGGLRFRLEDVEAWERQRESA